MKKFFVSYLTILSFCGILYPSKEKEKNLRNKVYVVFSEWDESFDLFGIYASFEGAKNAINNWAGDEVENGLLKVILRLTKVACTALWLAL